MKIYGLYGKSGTGKSYHAMGLAGKLGVDTLIDDGLIIIGNEVLAGTSAKRQKTKVGAIKTALFADDAHAEEARVKIREANPDAILILGTSPDMIKRIAERLELPEPAQLIDIAAITTEKERETALKMRTENGTHVIPAPTLQIKRQFSGYFMDPLGILRDLVPGKLKNTGERTLVRPTYSYLGGYEIADACLIEIIQHIAKKDPSIRRVSRIIIEPEADSVALQLSAVFADGSDIPGTALALQRNVRTAIEDMTALNISGVRVDVRGLQ